MTVQEVSRMLDIIKLAYPNFYGTKGAAHLDVQAICKLWAAMFVEDDFNVAMAAVQAFIVSDTSGFAPTIGQIKEMERKLFAREEGMNEAEAWGLISKAIRNGLYGAKEEFAKLPPELQRLVGTPAQLREWAGMDTSAIQSVVASNVQRSFRMVRERESLNAALPPEGKKLLGAVNNPGAKE